LKGAVTSLALLERVRAWEWVKDPLFARGGQGSRKIYDTNKNRTTITDRIIYTDLPME
jgi:hypothetical protein